MPRLPLASIFARASTSARVLAPSISLPRPSTSLSASFRTLSVSSSPLTLLRAARPALIPFPRVQQARCITYGCEYQPSQRKRKRKHGFLSRTKGDRNAFKMLIRRRAKGRRFLSH